MELNSVDHHTIEEDANTSRREYMRKYMKTRYDKEIEKSRAYNKSLKIKQKYNLTKEEFRNEFNRYGLHLHTIYKVKELMKQLPTEITYKLYGEIHSEVLNRKLGDDFMEDSRTQIV